MEQVDKSDCSSSSSKIALVPKPALKQNIDDKWRNGLNSMEKRWRAILKTNLKDQFPHDITLVVGNESKQEEISCHKFVLSLASPVFQNLVNEAEQSGESIKLPDVDPEIFKILLSHIYLDKLQISDQKMLETILVAQKFGIPDIMDQYSQQLTSNISKTNCVTIYQAADALSNQSLKDKANDFINENFEDILSSENFLKFTEKNLCEILKSESMEFFSELELFKAVQKWGENQCKIEGKEKVVENVKAVIQNIVPYIRFPTMSFEDFVSTIEPTNLLSSDDRADLFKYFAMRENNWKPDQPNVLEKFSTKMRNCKNEVLQVDLFSNWQCSGHYAWNITSEYMYDSFQLIGENTTQLYLKAVGFGTYPSYINQQVTVIVKFMRELDVVQQRPNKILALAEATYTPTSSTIAYFVELNKLVRILPYENYRVFYCVRSANGGITAQNNPVAEVVVFQHPSNPSKSVKVKYTDHNKCLTALKFSHHEYSSQ